MPKRQVKKTQIIYEEQKKEPVDERQRSREKARVEVVDGNSRRERLARLKNKKINEDVKENGASSDLKIQIQTNQKPFQSNMMKESNRDSQQKELAQQKEIRECKPKQESEEESQEGNQNKTLLKPVFIQKQDRMDEQDEQAQVRQAERKRKALKFTNKLLLKENMDKIQDSDDEEIALSSDEENRTDIPDDDDEKNEEFEYQLWKVRELKRIRRDKDERQKAEMQKAELQRRRKMNNEDILLENKLLGSDATENATQTKYVFMQKYYHKGAFYQDSEDPIFKRDYNLPTPLEMQDKSLLRPIMQKRKGQFGAKGQSKYTHLTAEDTTNFDPQFRPDESIMESWKKKMAGYKGSGSSNI